jgi:hypothetical protein
MVMFDERIAQLNSERRAKIEARTDTLHQEYVVPRERLKRPHEEMDY